MRNPAPIYRIRATRERDDNGCALYWSNADGWVDFSSADTFAARDGLRLPIGGEWESPAERDAACKEVQP